MTTQNYPKVAATVVAAMFLIVAGDTAATLITRDGTSQIFVAWTRFAIAAVVLAPFCAVTRSDFRADWRLVLRALLIVGGIVCILTALQTEPIANVFGAFFVGPIVAFALSVLLLKEQATWLRTALLLIGFAGVILVVKPAFGMTRGLAIALAAGTFYGGYLVATRWLAGAYRPRFLLLSQLVIGAIVLAPFGLADIPQFDLRLIGLLMISAMGSAIGNLLLVMANRVATANVIAPLIYSQLVHATFLGWLVFGDWPDALSLLGLSIILLSGIASVWASRPAT